MQMTTYGKRELGRRQRQNLPTCALLLPLTSGHTTAAGKIEIYVEWIFAWKEVHATARFCRASPSLAPVLMVSASSQ